ncbi:MAG: hypothetical protein RMZ69_10180 [Nostoc sp. ChiQUE01a]|nr:hypothetical protein [Nostoc sp. ChiQUE01a]
MPTAVNYALIFQRPIFKLQPKYAGKILTFHGIDTVGEYNT